MEVEKMNNVVYMTEGQERSNQLEVESNLASLFRERVETLPYGAHLRYLLGFWLIWG